MFRLIIFAILFGAVFLIIGCCCGVTVPFGAAAVTVRAIGMGHANGKNAIGAKDQAVCLEGNVTACNSLLLPQLILKT